MIYHQLDVNWTSNYHGTADKQDYLLNLRLGHCMSIDIDLFNLSPI